MSVGRFWSFFNRIVYWFLGRIVISWSWPRSRCRVFVPLSVTAATLKRKNSRVLRKVRDFTPPAEALTSVRRLINRFRGRLSTETRDLQTVCAFVRRIGSERRGARDIAIFVIAPRKENREYAAEG